MAKGLGVLNKLAGAVDSYHKKGSSPHPSSMGAKEGPSGPEHSREDDSPAAALAEHDQDKIHNVNINKLEQLMCPGCHDKLRAHLVANASGSKDPVSDLHRPPGMSE